MFLFLEVGELSSKPDYSNGRVIIALSSRSLPFSHLHCTDREVEHPTTQDPGGHEEAHRARPFPQLSQPVHLEDHPPHHGGGESEA